MKSIFELELENFTAGYNEALLFSESVQGPHGEDIENIQAHDLNAEALAENAEDCKQFLKLHGEKLLLAIAGSDDYDHTQAGRDFWFSRQGHGVGFWDRGLGLAGDDLHAAAQMFGQKHVFLDDDHMIGVE